MRLPPLKKWDAVRILWVDSSGLEGGWQTPSVKDMEVDGCVTVGQVYKVHKDRITVALSFDGHRHVHGGITIPLCAIKKITVLR